ncbi:YitT family protein [Proteiniclasticum sp. BAD-10]|uniref:YitT family protein n=1 Tax=Proteiniclasticum sediminis TaxID=2804028 RepID=A0A941CT37_9CLOT|nr:YitT family protein [Proteiniclasticum sediminis]MBR0577069.1 YitT family protein [Proteiniclasticum sediminis]
MKAYRSYFFITLGAMLVAMAIQLFFIPNQIAPGGVSGIGLILNRLIPAVSVSTYVLGLNILLFIVAFRILGGGFGFKTLYASFSLSIFMWILENVIRPANITEDLMLASLVGILLLGTGLGLVFNQDASTGGTDIVAKILQKYFHLSMGLSMTLIDLLVVLLVALMFGLERGLYAGLATFLNGVVINRVVGGFNEKKQVFIISSEKEKIRAFIVHEIERGATIFTGEGAFSGESNYVIYSVLSTKEFVRLKTFLRENVPEAFITVSSTTEVLGQGFSLPKRPKDKQ